MSKKNKGSSREEGYNIGKRNESICSFESP